MKISFLEIAKRITGFSTPVFGVSWEPPSLDVDRAKQILIFLEDRRVLYHPYAAENPEYAVESVLEIRKRLTAELEQLDRSSPLAESIAAMRAACRKFLDDTSTGIARPIGNQFGQVVTGSQMVYFSAYGELRAVFGIHIAQIAVSYGVNVEGQLETIFPVSPESDSETEVD